MESFPFVEKNNIKMITHIKYIKYILAFICTKKLNLLNASPFNCFLSNDLLRLIFIQLLSGGFYMDILKEYISKMTLEEKCSLLSGGSFWYTQKIDHLSIPQIMLTDGPHGLRKQNETADHLGINKSVKATCFPNACAIGASWNKQLIEEMSNALAQECLAENVSVILGPGLNIKRSPLCGRNFEYYSEDPFVSSQLGKHFILGCQKNGVGTSVKHFIANNQETRRLTLDVNADERTLREIYFASFETAIKEGKPYTVMCAYNSLNGEYGAENTHSLKEVLRDEWDYDGVVVTDWGGVNDRVKGLIATMDLEMPSSGGVNDNIVFEAVKHGKLDEKYVDESILRILNLIEKTKNARHKTHTFNEEHSKKIAYEMCCDSIVLLKNEANILPLKPSENILVVGAFSKTPRYQGGGSSHINPLFLTNAFCEMQKIGNVEYSIGFEILDEELDEYKAKDVYKKAEKADKVVVFAGLSERYETEGLDRKHIELAKCQYEVILNLKKYNLIVIVVLNNGSAVNMPWINDVKAIVESYLLGSAGGKAQADILYGIKNPSGKLAETFPKKIEDTPCFLNFPGEGYKVKYNEGVFVGYRYYDTKKIEALFAFGHGLSYTNFEYSNLKLNKQIMTDTEELIVCVDVKNTGDVKGKEIIQLYIHDKQTAITRPYKELKGFEKIELEASETKTVTFTLNKRSFAYFDINSNDWAVQNGQFDILIGKASDNIVLSETVTINSSFLPRVIFHANSTFHELYSHPKTHKLGAEMMEYFRINSGIDFELGDNADDFAFNVISDFPLKTLLQKVSFRQKNLNY